MRGVVRHRQVLGGLGDAPNRRRVAAGRQVGLAYHEHQPRVDLRPPPQAQRALVSHVSLLPAPGLPGLRSGPHEHQQHLPCGGGRVGESTVYIKRARATQGLELDTKGGAEARVKSAAAGFGTCGGVCHKLAVKLLCISGAKRPRDCWRGHGWAPTAVL